jgi:hypothetical protein
MKREESAREFVGDDAGDLQLDDEGRWRPWVRMTMIQSNL